MSSSPPTSNNTRTNVSAQPSFLDGKKPLDIVIIGGSCAGLFTGILLKKQGHNIRILEAARSNEREGVAAGVGLSAYVKRFFDENDRLKDTPFGVPNDVMEILDYDMNVQTTMPIHMRATTWDAMYYRLRANFDAYRSPYCHEPPDVSSDAGTGVFETGKKVLRVEDGEGGKLTVWAEDVEKRETQSYQADAVIAADGANSPMRRQLLPSLQSEAPGYVLWRGTVPTKALSQKLLDRIEGKTFMYRMRQSYIILYTVPGPNGTLAPGTRVINVAWYTWTTAAAAKDILTDTNGHTHRATLPKGLMRPEIWKRQLARASEMIHPDLVEIVQKIEAPFVSLISSISSPRATFFDGRLFLVGDALAQKQPNTAMGVNLAAKNSLELADVFAGGKGVAEWEGEVVREGRRETVRSAAFGAWYLDGWVGWLWWAARYRLILLGQRWMGV